MWAHRSSGTAERVSDMYALTHTHTRSIFYTPRTPKVKAKAKAKAKAVAKRRREQAKFVRV